MSELIKTLQAAICTEIIAALPKLRECKPHDGRFDLDELKSFITRAPGVRVACLGFKAGKETAYGFEWRHEAMMAAYVVTKDQKGLARGDAAMAIVETIAAIAGGSRWGQSADHVGEAMQVEAQNLYSRELGKTAVALWVVGWMQPVSFAKPELDGSELVPFLHYHSDWDVAPYADPAPDTLPIPDPDATNDVILEGAGP